MWILILSFKLLNTVIALVMCTPTILNKIIDKFVAHENKVFIYTYLESIKPVSYVNQQISKHKDVNYVIAKVKLSYYCQH